LKILNFQSLILSLQFAFRSMEGYGAEIS
jgi:hypothetical protein